MNRNGSNSLYNGDIYYDIDQILSEEEHLSSEFTLKAIDCGYLDSGSADRDLEEGTRLDLPIWLIKTLAPRREVNVKPPQYLSSKYRTHIIAGPASINLRNKSPYFYEVGRHTLEILPPGADSEKKEIIEILRITFSGERYREIFDQAMNSRDKDTTEFTRKLTHVEKNLFDAGLECSKEYYRWKSRQSEILKNSYLLDTQVKKRKLIWNST